VVVELQNAIIAVRAVLTPGRADDQTGPAPPVAFHPQLFGDQLLQVDLRNSSWTFLEHVHGPVLVQRVVGEAEDVVAQYLS